MLFSVCKGEEPLIEPYVLPVLGVGTLDGIGESSTLLKAFLLLAEDGVLNSRPKKDLFLSMLSRPSFELLPLRMFLWLRRRISSMLVEVNKNGASVLALKGLDKTAGCCEGSGIGSSQSVAKSACTFGVWSFSGEVILRAVMRSMSKFEQPTVSAIVACEAGVLGEDVHLSGVEISCPSLSSSCGSSGLKRSFVSSKRSGLSPFKFSKASSVSK